MSQDLPHHDQTTADSDPSFSGCLVRVTIIWFLHLLLMIENRRLWISLSAETKFFGNTANEQIC